MNLPEDLKLVVSEDEQSLPAQELNRFLTAHNTESYGAANRQPLILSIHQNEQLVAGLRGYTHWGWLYISHLWVAASHRNQHLGAILVKEAEALAITRNCPRFYIDTFSPDALRFYQRLGYELFGQLPDFPPSHTRYFLRKYSA